MEIEGPITQVARLDDLEELWKELHAHHLEVATFAPLVADADTSWIRRRRWYERLLSEDGVMFLAADDDGTYVGYALAAPTAGADDTFEVKGGIVEIVSLVVTNSQRGNGVGARLVRAVRDFASHSGMNTVKVALMTGNAGARSFYEDNGFRPAEEVMYFTEDAN
jgi:GNAT superfamily N-acetyltransferase